MFEYASYDQETIVKNNLRCAAKLIEESKKMLVITGAGISVSSGIPDFRSNGGIYAKIKEKHPEINDVGLLFDINFFATNPGPFFSLLKMIYDAKIVPSYTHKFVKELENRNKLLRNYTQNIDSLEKAAGIKKLCQCHGSLDTATCICCGFKTKQYALKPSVMLDLIPTCPECARNDREGILKPDVVFFGEDVTQDFRNCLKSDRFVCDLLLVIGSSMTVNPVASIPKYLRKFVPKILINKTSVANVDWDLQLIGDADEIIEKLHFCMLAKG